MAGGKKNVKAATTKVLNKNFGPTVKFESLPSAHLNTKFYKGGTEISHELQAHLSQASPENC